MFTTPKTFVDAAFFAQLAKVKLEEQKLAKDELAIEAELQLTPHRPTTARLSERSFAPAHARSDDGNLHGTLLNVNSLDEFKRIDKVAMQKERVAELCAAVGTAASQPPAAAKDLAGLLTRFVLLTFADLKKYKFYYWFMFPQAPWASRVENGSTDPDLSQMLSKRHATELPLLCCIENDDLCSLERMTPQSRFLVLAMDGAAYPWYMTNFVTYLSLRGYTKAEIYVYRDHVRGSVSEDADTRAGTSPSAWITVHIQVPRLDGTGGAGWERNSAGKLSPKLTDLSSLLNPLQLAGQAVDLNLKLMKWRACPDINLERIADSKCLLLGAGTLGSYIARGLLAWGVRHITFIDNGTVSYSNPVRQPLYTFDDCVAQNPKAEAAAEMLRRIFPQVTAAGHTLEVLMAGHPLHSYNQQKSDFKKLESLIKEHDVVFLLMDSRESRWLPTLICSALNKLIINVALGFDSYVVMRHGMQNGLGCYFCNDIVAPQNSVSNQPLDQMCTVTRPGVAVMASAYAVELLAVIMQHKYRGRAPLNASTVLGDVYHQLRGFLLTTEVMKIHGEAFSQCPACGESVKEAYLLHGFDFVERALNEPAYLTEISGLGDIQRTVEDFSDLELDDDFIE